MSINPKQISRKPVATLAILLLASCGASDQPADETLKVTSVSPTDGATVDAFPTAITLSFNSDLLVASVDAGQFQLSASGGDSSFGDGNETAVVITSASANGSVATLDVAAAAATAVDDQYQLVVVSQDASAIANLDGDLLDGDGNEEAGGNFVSTFTFTTQVVVAATLSEIQQQIFTPNCATSGCHAGASPAQGMNLSDGQAFSNIVNVASAEVPSLNRILPNDTINSYLIQKVQGTAAVGSRMPLGGTALSAAQIQLLTDWVNDGASDN